MAADYGGLDGLVDKYKEHFGGWAAKLFLIIVGFGVLAITIGVALQWIVTPILRLFEASPAVALGANLLVFFLLAVAGGAIIASVVILRRLKALMRRAEGTAGQAAALLETNIEKAAELERRAGDLRLLGKSAPKGD